MFSLRLIVLCVGGVEWVEKKKFASAASCCCSRYIWSCEDTNTARGLRRPPPPPPSLWLSGSISHECVVFSLLVAALPPPRPPRPSTARKETILVNHGSVQKDTGSELQLGFGLAGLINATLPSLPTQVSSSMTVK